MVVSRFWPLMLALGLLGIALQWNRPAVAAHPATAATAPWDGRLSVLTYNVKGSDWPIASNRTPALAEIAARLLEMRKRGRQPHIVVLQEAFNEAARAIGREAGYRYVVDGPAATEVDPASMNAGDAAFASEASWRYGETEGKFFGSGLQILSDYPVERIHRLAWPGFACAGFDCMANKGAVMATVRLPGGEAVEVLTTHFNSRNSSGVSDARSLYAYGRQADYLTAFVNRWHDPARPLIAAGDFNVGQAAPRARALGVRVAEWKGASAFHDALHDVTSASRARGVPMPSALQSVLHHNVDFEFFTSGTRERLCPSAIRVPFGPDAEGRVLSDHIGYIAEFRLDCGMK